MSKMTLNELAALKLVLDHIELKDLLSSAMITLSEKDDTHSKDQANVCSEAITVFLN